MKFKKYIIFSLLGLMIMTSCAEEAQKPKSQDAKEQVNKSLEKIQGDTETLIEDIEKIMEISKKPITVMEDEKKKEDNPDNPQNDQENSESSESQKKESEDKKKEKTYEEKKRDELIKRKEEAEKSWMKAYEQVKKLHNQLNDYKIIAIKDGANDKAIASLDNAINNLTIAIENKNELESLIRANHVTFSLANFFDMYKGNIEGDLNRIRYSSREVYIESLKDDFKKAKEEGQKSPEYYTRLSQRIKLDKEDEKMLDMLNLSIKDLINVIQYNNKELIKVKRDVVLKNIDAIKEAAK